MRADPDSFTTVFHGTMAEAAMVQAMLEAQGVHARIESHNMKTVHPFITGNYVFDVEVKAPLREAPMALEIIASAREDREKSADKDMDAEGDGEVDEEAVRAADVRRLEGLGRRLRWGMLVSALLLISPPAGALACTLYSIFALSYLFEARRLRYRPRGHWLTVGAFAIVLLFLALTVWINAAWFLPDY